MDHFVRSVRFAGVGAVGGFTLLAGAALVWYFVQPETLPLLSTWQLGAIMGTFILPLLCFAVWQADRKVTAAAPVRRRRPAGIAPGQAPDGAEKPAGAPVCMPAREAPLRQPMAAPTPLVLTSARVETDALPAKGSGRLSHRPRRTHRFTHAPAHRHRRFADV